MAKTREWVCPMCGSDDTTEMHSGFEDMCAYSHMRCDKCGAEWDDNFSVEYCGYNIHTEDGDTKLYNAEGERDMTAFEELKAWCAKHLDADDYKVVPKSPSFGTTIYFQEFLCPDDVGMICFFPNGSVANVGTTTGDDMVDHIEEYERRMRQ